MWQLLFEPLCCLSNRRLPAPCPAAMGDSSSGSLWTDKVRHTSLCLLPLALLLTVHSETLMHSKQARYGLVALDQIRSGPADKTLSSLLHSVPGGHGQRGLWQRQPHLWRARAADGQGGLGWGKGVPNMERSGQ